MKREQIETLIITRRQDVQYITGLYTEPSAVPVGCVIIQGAMPQLIIPDEMKGGILPGSVMGRVHTFVQPSSESKGLGHESAFWDEVSSVLRQAGLSKEMMGVQHEWLSVRGFDRLKATFPEAGFKDVSEAIWKIKQVKDSAEIELIRKAVVVAEIGLRMALETVEASKTEEEVSQEIESVLRGAGAQRDGTRAVVLSGERAMNPRARPLFRPIGSKSFVTLDITVNSSGYFAEVSRTIHLGRPSDEQRKFFKFVSNARKQILKNLEPDVMISELVGKVRKKSGRHFPSDSLIVPLGSCIGLDIREHPSLSPGSEQSLRAGMVFVIRPTGFSPELGCVTMADVVLITDDGHELLSTLSTETL